MVVACLALFAALGGTAVAATQIGHPGNTAIRSATKKAKRGPRGKRGAPGAKGATGAPGTPGTPGTPGAVGPSTVYAAHHDAEIDIKTASAGSPLTVATLSGLPAGSYAIQAKLNASSETASEDFTKCTLVAEDSSDYADDYLGDKNFGNSFRAVFALQVVHTFASGGSASIQCYHSIASTAFVREIKITAIKVGSIAADTGV